MHSSAEEAPSGSPGKGTSKAKGSQKTPSPRGKLKLRALAGRMEGRAWLQGNLDK
jgi:hypothetical protein